MNSSKTNKFLHQISDTIVNAPSSPTFRCRVDEIPALSLNSGSTISTTLRTTIATDDNVSTKLSSIDTALTNILLTTSNQYNELQTIDTSLNNIEADMDNLNDNRKLNFSSQYQNLQWSGSSNSLSSGDYSSTTGKAWFQNTSGDSMIITKITVGFSTSETTWSNNKVFTSTSSAGTSWIKWGTGNDTTAIDTEIIKFNNNGEMTSCLTRVFDAPNGGGDVFYGWSLDGLNIILDNNEYFICEFSGTINASGDNDLWSGIFVDVKQS